MAKIIIHTVSGLTNTLTNVDASTQELADHYTNALRHNTPFTHTNREKDMDRIVIINPANITYIDIMKD